MFGCMQAFQTQYTYEYIFMYNNALATHNIENYIFYVSYYYVVNHSLGYIGVTRVERYVCKPRRDRHTYRNGTTLSMTIIA